jgi:hypothetical protein
MLIRRLTLTLALFACCSTAIAQGVTPFCDVLYWRASEETSAVWSNVFASSASGSSLSAETMQFDWSPGFRVGFGHQLAPDSWDVKLYWTYFRTSNEAAASGDIVVPEFFSGAISGDGRSFSSGAIDWSLTYNTIDLEAGRKVAVGESAWIRPSMGIKAAIMRQRIQLGLANPGLSISAEEDVTNNFWGIGPSFGIGGAWNLPRCSNLSLTGSFSADFLIGQWNVNDAYTRTDNQLPVGVYGAMVTSMKDSWLGVPVLRYFLGVQWAHEGRVAITVRAGYELQWWANQQRLPAFQQLPMHGDLTLTGLTCGVSVGF